MDGKDVTSKETVRKEGGNPKEEPFRTESGASGPDGLSLREELERTLECLQRLRDAINRVPGISKGGGGHAGSSETGGRNQRRDNLQRGRRFSGVLRQPEQRYSGRQVEKGASAWVQLDLSLDEDVE